MILKYNHTSSLSTILFIFLLLSGAIKTAHDFIYLFLRKLSVRTYLYKYLQLKNNENIIKLLKIFTTVLLVGYSLHSKGIFILCPFLPFFIR